MPEKRTIERAKKDLRQGKSASTAAGEFVKEEMEHIREGKHGARSAKQAIAIGLSQARRAGIPLRKPRRASAKTEASIESAERGRGKPVSKTRSRAVEGALKREGRSAASPAALSRQTRSASRQRTAADRSAAAKKAARTKGPGTGPRVIIAPPCVLEAPGQVLP